MKHRKIQITVIGDSTEIEKNNRIAYDVGKVIAKNGWVLVNGGREAVMREAAKGAIECGGMAVSILPDEDINAGHPYRSISIASGIGYARNSMNVLSADIVVVVGGGSGTLSEIGYAWAYGKPIVTMVEADGWGEKLAGQSIDRRRRDTVIGVKTAKELETVLRGLVKKLEGNVV